MQEGADNPNSSLLCLASGDRERGNSLILGKAEFLRVLSVIGRAGPLDMSTKSNSMMC